MEPSSILLKAHTLFSVKIAAWVWGFNSETLKFEYYPCYYQPANLIAKEKVSIGLQGDSSSPSHISFQSDPGKKGAR